MGTWQFGPEKIDEDEITQQATPVMKGGSAHWPVHFDPIEEPLRMLPQLQQLRDHGALVGFAYSASQGILLRFNRGVNINGSTRKGLHFAGFAAIGMRDEAAKFLFRLGFAEPGARNHLDLFDDLGNPSGYCRSDTQP